jgi:hypothetical protein
MGCIGLNRVVAGPLLFSEVAKYYSQKRSEHPVEYVLLFVGPVLQILSGAFVLLGHNWARWLLGVWIGFLVVASAGNSNFKVAIVDLVWLVTAVYYLFRPRAKAFFTGPFEAVAPPGEDGGATDRLMAAGASGGVRRAAPPSQLS